MRGFAMRSANRKWERAFSRRPLRTSLDCLNDTTELFICQELFLVAALLTAWSELLIPAGAAGWAFAFPLRWVGSGSPLTLWYYNTTDRAKMQAFFVRHFQQIGKLNFFVFCAIFLLTFCAAMWYNSSGRFRAWRCDAWHFLFLWLHFQTVFSSCLTIQGRGGGADAL